MRQFFYVIAFALIAGCTSNKSKEVDWDSQVKEEMKIAKSRLDSTKFDVLEESYEYKVFNYYLLYKGSTNKDSINDFIKRFRDVHCAPSNINLLDSKEIYPTIKENPLSDDEYVFVADHFVAFSSFDVPENVSIYPYKDLRYNELKNRKE